MIRNPVFPCFHPTTVYWVDDDAEFLYNASLSLQANIPCKLYKEPEKILDDLRLTEREVAPWQYCLEPDFSFEQEVDEELFRYKFSKFFSEAMNQRRFERVSVVIIDFEMRGMNGLELCHELDGGSFKKIMLTSKVEEKSAISALNNKLIDRFIFKHTDSMETELNKEINSLQVEYFSELSSVALGCLKKHSLSFLSDPVFIDFFEKFRRDHGIVEYYLSKDPPGFYVIDLMGQAKFLVVQNKEYLDEQVRYIKDVEGPNDLCELILSEKWCPLFPAYLNYYDPELMDWKNQLHPAQKIRGNESYFYSIIEGEKLFTKKEVLQEIHPFRAYLNSIEGKRFSSNPFVN